VVASFVLSNNCVSVGQFQVCKDVDIALWIDANQTVETVYLYLNNGDGYAAYTGKLPFDLKFYDTMGAVEYKLNRKGIGHNGLPDATAVVDHFHDCALYKEAGITVLYNSPFADEDATIYAVLVSA